MASVTKLGEGRTARYRVQYRTIDNQRRSKHFDRKAEADSFANQVETDKARGTFTDPSRGRLTFDKWADRWLELPHGTRPTTRARDESYLRSLIRPGFARRRLRDISRNDVQAWVHGLVERDLAPATIHKAVQVLAKILDAAVREDRIATNPARDVALPRLPDAEARFLTSAELIALERTMPERLRVLVPFVADVGLRIGEVAGLRWRDVDTFHGTVTVREVLTEVHGQALLGPPKTAAGRRVVPTLTREVGGRLEALRGAPDGFVFTSPKGGPLRPAAFRSRVWRPAVAASELAEPLPTPHSLRHAAVAHWIAAGVDPFRLAKWAGHRSVATIYKVYGHLLTDDATVEREALSALRAAAVEAVEQSAKVLPLRVVGANGSA